MLPFGPSPSSILLPEQSRAWMECIFLHGAKRCHCWMLQIHRNKRNHMQRKILRLLGTTKIRSGCFLMRCNHVHLQYKIFKLLEIICSVKSWGFWANPPSHLHLSKNIIQISSPDVKTQRLFHWSKNNLKRWWTPSAKPVYEKNFLFFTEILDMLDIF